MLDKTKSSQIGAKITALGNHTAPSKSKTKGEHEQWVQELLVNKMERSRDIGIGNEITGAAEISKGESSKEEV